MTLLIVDDEKYICDSVAGGTDWHEHGIENVFTANNVRSALELLKNKTVDVMITDIRMPDLSGIDLIKYMAAASPKTKIIVISGYDKFEYACEALKYGVSDYLLKPVRVEDIVESVKKALAKINEEHSFSQDNLAVLKYDFLYKLLNNSDTNSLNIKENISRFQLNVFDNRFKLVLFSYEISDQSEWDKYADSWLVKVGMENILNEYFEGKFNFEIFDDKSNHLIMFAASDEGMSDYDLRHEINECCALLTEKMELSSVYAIISDECNNISEIAGMYKRIIRFIGYPIKSQNANYVYGFDDFGNMKNNILIADAMDYVKSHIYGEIAVYDVCRSIGLSPNYFSSLFKKITGLNFTDYVNNEKISIAKKYLATSDKSVAQISELLGFSYDKYFIRVFKKYAGVSPAVFRSQIKNKD